MEKYIENLVSQLTLEEKIRMLHGATLFRTGAVERLDIPELSMSDGPMGVRAEFVDNEWRLVGNPDDYVSYLPCNSAVASTWSRELAGSAGSTLGEEARGRGKDVILAPGINIKRNPLCGRNFEYMSEDPYLVSELVVPMVQGIQSHDVAACVKHFAANSQETERLWVDTVVDERTLQEIYFPGFKAAVEKGGIFSLMGAYNRLNGEHCCTGKSLLGKVLRDQWKFDGMIVSDWGGVHDTDLAVNSPLDIEMDVRYGFENHYMAQPLLKKIENGEVSEELVDTKVRNILRLMLRLKMIGPAKNDRKAGCYNTKAHQSAALDVARESLILLKNEENTLPFAAKNVKKVAVIGANAVTMHSFGGGSAEIKALYEVTPLMGIKMHLGGNARVSYVPGYPVPKPGARPEISWQATSTDSEEERDVSLDGEKVQGGKAPEPVATEETIREAVELAKQSDAVIFVGGLNHDYDVEGLDRGNMTLPYGQDALIEALLEARPDTVIVMYAGSPVAMPWAEKAKTILWSYYAGMEGGTALAEVLFGAVNPSGKLAETLIRDLEQCPARQGVNFALKDKVVYDDGVMVGYRHYNTVNADVLFPFGHGISYTNYEYSGLTVEGDVVSLTVSNVGNVTGKETVQMYIAPMEQGSIVRPAHQLRGFEKIELAPGEKKTVRFVLSEMDFAVYDVEKGAFCQIPGEYEVQIGASSRDIRLKAVVKR